MISQMRGALKALDAPSKPMWITELNYNLLQGELPLSKQLELIEGTDIVMMTTKINRCYWYAYEHDDPNLLGVTFSKDSATLRKLVQLNS